MKFPTALLLASSLVASAQVSNDPLGEKPPSFHVGESKLDGIWSRDVGESVAVKHYFSGRYNLTYANRSSGVINYHMIGFFAQKDAIASELPKFTTENWVEFHNKPRVLKLGFEGDEIFSHVDSAGKKEVWFRKNGSEVTKSLDGVADFSPAKTALEGCWFYEESFQGKPYRSFQVFDKGRWSLTHYYLRSKIVTRHMIGIYSFDGKILRQKVLYATENWKEKIGSTGVSKITFGENRYHQISADGWKHDWSRGGPRPKDAPFPTDHKK